MALNFDLKHRDVIDETHQLEVYRFNLAKNYALLSGDSAVVRRFYREKASSLQCGDIYKHAEISRSFFYNARPTNAFVYAGLIPWIVESMVRLVASPGFVVNSPLQGGEQFDAALQKDMNNYVQKESKQIKLQDLFEQGVFWETGIGDLLFRISYDSEISDKPIIDVIEAPGFEIEWKRGHIRTITIKERTNEITDGEQKTKIDVEMHETYSKTKDGKVKVTYSFHVNNHKIAQRNKLYDAAKKWWGIDEMSFDLPFKDFPLVYKKSSKSSLLYRGERGVPDIHGLDTLEDALSECLSNLVDTIRKSAPKTFVDEEMLPSTIDGKTAEYSDFDHEYLIMRNTGLDPSKLLTTQQAKIDYASHLETAKMLISHAINKVGLSPTTLGVTGLESINSSAESQDAREKPSLRTREIKLKGWKETLEEILNKYFQYLAYVKKETIKDYSDIISVSFNEYINPSTENVVSVIAQAVSGRVYSIELGVEKQFINDKKDYTLEDIIAESARIRGIPPKQEMVLLGLVKAPQETDLPVASNNAAANQNEPTKALKEEEDGRNANSGTATNDDTDGD